jgi:hypothetical protein
MPNDELSKEERRAVLAHVATDVANVLLPEVLKRMRPPDPFGGVPVWVKISLYLGFPAAVAVFFMGQSAGYIPTTFLTKTEFATHAKSHDQHRARQEELTQTLAIGLKVICQNAAHTAAELHNCDNIKTSISDTLREEVGR